MTDLRTSIEKAREEKYKKICNMFIDLSNNQPKVAPHRIFGAIAKEVGMTVPGIRSIIVKNGLYKTRY